MKFDETIRLPSEKRPATKIGRGALFVEPVYSSTIRKSMEMKSYTT